MSDQHPPKVTCPKCGSDQIVAGKKGFSGTKAVAGAVLTGGIGLLAGTIGSNKIKITCLNCGHVFKPGESYNQNVLQEKTEKLHQQNQELIQQRKNSDVVIANFVAEYEKGEKELAFENLKNYDSAWAARLKNPDNAYRRLKSAKWQAKVGCALVIAIGLAILVLIAYLDKN
jgi:rubredoxin